MGTGGNAGASRWRSIVIYLPKILLIAGNGRNSGKTTFACNIIRTLCNSVPLVAAKISPHQYDETGGSNISNIRSFTVIEETSIQTVKDSSRMLEAGAKRSFFISSSDDQLNEAINAMLDIAGKDVHIIAESGGLGEYIIPGLFFVVNRKDRVIEKEGVHKNLAKNPILVTFDGTGFDFNVNKIDTGICGWHLKQDYDNI